MQIPESIQLDRRTSAAWGLFIVSVVLTLGYIITAPVNVDEGWYHAVASAKNQRGLYTFPPFYDIPLFKGEIMIFRDLTTQFYRLFDLLFNSAITGISLLRIFWYAVWVASFFNLVNKLFSEYTLAQRLIILSSVTTCPIVFWVFGIARPEVPISAMVALLLAIPYKKGANLDHKLLEMLAVSAIALFFHPNGVVFLLLFVLIALLMVGPKKAVKHSFLAGGVAVTYFLVFIDNNLPLYKEQYQILFHTGNEEKFIQSLGMLPRYLVSEIANRYLCISSLDRVLSFETVCLVTTLAVAISGLYALIREHRLRIPKYCVVVVMIFLVLLGNKTPLYLLYISPILALATIYRLTRGKALRVVPLAVICFCTIIAVSIPINLKERAEIRLIADTVKQTIKPNETIYAPLALEPYLAHTYNFVTTSHKSKIGAYSLFNIKPQNCVIIAERNDAIWGWSNGRQVQIGKIGSYYITKIEQ